MTDRDLRSPELSEFLLRLRQESAEYLSKVDDGDVPLSDAIPSTLSDAYSDLHPGLSRNVRMVVEDNSTTFFTAPRTIKYAPIRSQSSYDFLDYFKRMATGKEVSDESLMFETTPFSTVIADPVATAENKYENALFSRIVDSRDVNHKVSVVNPSKGTVYRMMETGVPFNIVSVSNDPDYNRNLQELAGPQMVLRTVPEGSIAYSGPNGKFIGNGVTYCFIPNPYNGNRPGMISVSRETDGIHMTYKRKSWIQTALLPFNCEGYLYPPEVVDGLLGQSDRSFFLMTTELLKNKGISPWSFVESHRLPDFPKYELVDIPEIGSYYLSRDDRFIYDIQLNVTWYSKRGLMLDAAERLGLEIVPYDPKGSYCVNHYTISPVFSPLEHEVAGVVDTSKPRFVWTGKRLLETTWEANEPGLVSGSDPDEVMAVATLSSSTTLDIFGKLEYVETKGEKRMDISLGQMKAPTTADRLYKELELKGTLDLREYSSSRDIEKMSLIRWVWSRPELYIDQGRIVKTFPSLPLTTTFGNFKEAYHQFITRRRIIIKIQDTVPPEIYRFLRDNGFALLDRSYDSILLVNSRWLYLLPKEVKREVELCRVEMSIDSNY